MPKPQDRRSELADTARRLTELLEAVPAHVAAKARRAAKANGVEAPEIAARLTRVASRS